MNKTDSMNCRIDVLAIGLFGLAVGALTVGLAQVGLAFAELDKVGVLVIRARVWRNRTGTRGRYQTFATTNNSAGRRSRCMASSG